MVGYFRLDLIGMQIFIFNRLDTVFGTWPFTIAFCEVLQCMYIYHYLNFFLQILMFTHLILIMVFGIQSFTIAFCERCSLKINENCNIYLYFFLQMTD